MVVCVVIVCAADLLALCVETLHDVIARVTLFTWLRISCNPNKLLRARDIAVIFFNNLYTLAQSVVSELAAVGAEGNCG